MWSVTRNAFLINGEPGKKLVGKYGLGKDTVTKQGPEANCW